MLYQPRVIGNVFLRSRQATLSLPQIWFIHGFGESSLSFNDAFASAHLQNASLFAPDFPGYGVSPFDPAHADLDGAVNVLLSLLELVGSTGNIWLVGHSIGSVIAVRTVHRAPEKIAGVFSIEGNLTEDDGFFTGLTMQYKAGRDFFVDFSERIQKEAASAASFRRYAVSVAMSHPDALMGWGQSASQTDAVDRYGEDFRTLPCRSRYYWDSASTSAKTASFIQQAGIDHRQYQGGHWPMYTIPDTCYREIANFCQVT